MLRLIVDNSPIEQPKGLPMLNTSYSEASYFDGFAFAHIAAFEEERRLRRIRKEATKAIQQNERRKNGRALFR